MKPTHDYKNSVFFSYAHIVQLSGCLQTRIEKMVDSPDSGRSAVNNEE
jgi:hypothetical protein